MDERIGKLLAKAEATTSEPEREALIAKAQEIATRHGIDMATAAARAAHGTLREEIISRRVEVGPPRRRANPFCVELAAAVGEANNLVVTGAHNSTFVEFIGYASDVEVAHAIYASLVLQMIGASDRHIRNPRADWRREVMVTRATGRDSWGLPVSRNELRPKTAQRARDEFLTGFVAGVRRRLSKARRDTVRQSQAGTDVVLLDRAQAVRRHFEERNPNKREWSSSRATREGSSYTHGSAAGSTSDTGGGSLASTRRAIGPSM